MSEAAATSTVDPVARSARLLDRAGPLALRGLFALYLFLWIVLPLAALVAKGLGQGPAAAWEAISDKTALDALRLSITTGVIAAVVNGVAGTALAWMLVRWEFPGRSAVAWLVDLPLAIPTLVAGILLVALYGPQTWLGGTLEGFGIEIVFAQPGIIMALLFVTLPFVVRTVEPILVELDPAEEEASNTLGATPFQTFTRVLLPPILPAMAAGSVQTFARCVAEFGSVAVVSGNIPRHTLTAPVWIQGEVEAGNPDGAAAVSLVLLALALVLHPLSGLLIRTAGGRRG